jgi:RNA polymerase sigma-70 factor (ECF subfamily)
MSVQCLSGGPSVRARLTSALLLGRDGVELIQDTRDISRDTRFDDRQEAGVKPAHVIDWSETDDSECNVAERCATGDPQACQDLVDTHQRMVYHLALQLLNNHEDALDLSQDVFLTVFRSIHRFRGDSALQTWIYRIVINQARNRQRWWRRRRRADQVSLDAIIAERGELPAPAGSTSPELALDQKQLGARLWRALNRLPFDQRSAVVLRELHGMRYAEIAFSLGVTNAAVKSRLARARQTLRTELRAP